MPGAECGRGAQVSFDGLNNKYRYICASKSTSLKFGHYAWAPSDYPENSYTTGTAYPLFFDPDKGRKISLTDVFEPTRPFRCARLPPMSKAQPAAPDPYFASEE